MTDDSPGRCGLDSRVYQSPKDKRKFITVYGDNDKYLLYEEYIKRKKRKKYNRSEGNKDGRRYCIVWASGKISNYFFTLNQAKYIAQKNSKNKNLGNPTIFEETKDENDWIITYEQELPHYE